MESGCNKERHICLVAREGRSDGMPRNASKDVKIGVSRSSGKRNTKDSPFLKRQTPPTAIQGSGSLAHNNPRRRLRFPTSTSLGPWPPSNPACPPISHGYATSASPPRSRDDHSSRSLLRPHAATRTRSIYTGLVLVCGAGSSRFMSYPSGGTARRTRRASARSCGPAVPLLLLLLREVLDIGVGACLTLCHAVHVRYNILCRHSERGGRQSIVVVLDRDGAGARKGGGRVAPGTCLPRWASPFASFTALQETLSQSEDDPSDASSVAGSETSLDLDSDPDDDSSDASYVDDSGNDFLDGEEVADLSRSYL